MTNSKCRMTDRLNKAQSTKPIEASGFFSRNILRKKGVSTVEYVLLILFFLGAFFVFQKYIFGALAGRWRTVGDSFGFGRQYHPVNTLECAYDQQYYNAWYDLFCFNGRHCLEGDAVCTQAGIAACLGCACNSDGACNLVQEGCGCSDCASDPSCSPAPGPGAGGCVPQGCSPPCSGSCVDNCGVVYIGGPCDSPPPES